MSAEWLIKDQGRFEALKARKLIREACAGAHKAIARAMVSLGMLHKDYDLEPEGAPCHLCGHFYDIEGLGHYGCPNCNGEGLE